MDNEKLPLVVSESKRGLLQVEVKQSGRLEVYYKGTIVQKISFYITIIGIILLVVYIISMNRRRYKSTVK